MEPAADIYQAHLDHVSAALWAEDFDAVAAAMAYPHSISTTGSDSVMTDPGAIASAAATFRASMRNLGATAYHRVCVAARYAPAPDRIEGSHTTYVLRGGTFVRPPYGNDMSLARNGDRWLGTGIRSAVRNADLTVTRPNRDAADVPG